MGGLTGNPETPSTLILGWYSPSGWLRIAARTALLAASARDELCGALTPADVEHSWPEEVPAGWAVGLPGMAEPIPYTRVVPDVVMEIGVDAAAENGRWRHAVRYLRRRADLSPADELTGVDLE
ncbi:hypothetical protein [Actinomadura fibrosa]|uniref:ATP-dependent DNA ligase n=1 Tax=Actinomadura fibrosa TaxID=111802 RepID=A0ABW2XM23_9ACTN|nr:hypothetical protein [Actinomadura fibrosa]